MKQFEETNQTSTASNGVGYTIVPTATLVLINSTHLVYSTDNGLRYAIPISEIGDNIFFNTMDSSHLNQWKIKE